MDSSVEEIKNKIDVVDLISSYIKLNKAGNNYKAVCPFHSEKTPSFMVSPERQIWHCFGCGKGGSVFDFIMEMEGLEFSEALKILAQRAGVELKKVDPKLKTEKTRIYEICQLATQFFIRQLEASQEGQKMQKYLKERGLKQETLKEWQIGYTPNTWESLVDFLSSRGYPKEEVEKSGLAIKSRNKANSFYDRFRDRIVFPIKDINGTIVGFSARQNPYRPDEKMGKYINTPNTLIYDKSKILFGLDKAKLEIRKQDSCILVEGQMDVIMSHQAGFSNVIATSGTSLTEIQLKTIKRYTDNLATAFDMDSAGEIATKRSVDLAIENGFNTKVITLKESKDPADYIREDVSLWQESINNAKEIIKFYLETAFSKYDTKSVEGKKNISQTVLPIIKKIPNKIEQAHWLQETASKLQIQENILEQELAKIEINQNYYQKNKQEQKNDSNNNQKNLNLEEHLIGLVFLNPSILENKEIQSIESDFFQDQDLKLIFKKIKRKKNNKINLKNFKKSLPENISTKLDYLIFKAEAQQEICEDFNLKKEAQFCCYQMKKRHFKEKINQLNLAIQEAEKSGDKEKLKKLTQEVIQITSCLNS